MLPIASIVFPCGFTLILFIAVYISYNITALLTMVCFFPLGQAAQLKNLLKPGHEFNQLLVLGEVNELHFLSMHFENKKQNILFSVNNHLTLWSFITQLRYKNDSKRRI
jgi:hypothetical protein